MLVDSHCHLDFPEFAPDFDAVLERARAADVGAMVTIPVLGLAAGGDDRPGLGRRAPARR